jgi:hypothetical protein
MLQAAVTKLEFRKAEALFARAAAEGCARSTAAIPTRSKRAPNGSIGIRLTPSALSRSWLKASRTGSPEATAR